MNASVEFISSDRALVARMSGEIDHHTARWVREKIDGEFLSRSSPTLELDFSSVSFMDSSAIALIIGRHELILKYGGMLRLSGLSKLHRRLVLLSGIERLSNISIKDE